MVWMAFSPSASGGVRGSVAFWTRWPTSFFWSRPLSAYGGSGSSPGGIGATIYNFRIETVQPEPTLISKLNTVLQIALAAVGVAALGFTGIPGWVVETLIWAVMVTILLSGTGYVREWSRRARVVGSRHDV
jgi:hypothetical protein